jgi:hypothetical protein
VDLENLIYRIINGNYTINVENCTYKVLLPNIHIKHNAHSIYLKTIDEHKYDTSSWITSKNIDNLLKIYNIWNTDKEEKFEALLKDLDQYKINLFRNYINLSIRTSIKTTIDIINQNIDELYTQKHCFDYLTLEYYAQNIKNQYLIANMIYSVDNEKIFIYDNFENIDSMFLEKILIEIQKNSINSSTIKKIARHELWRSFWNVSKENIFEGKIKDWTDEQRSLINFTNVLDSVREHMEAPSEEIIKDDDALDGWILHQNQKNEQQKTKQLLDQKFNLSKKNAGEVFVISQDKNERKAINDLNDVQTKKDIKNMIKLSNEKAAGVNWGDLPHVRRELQQQVKNKGSK